VLVILCAFIAHQVTWGWLRFVTSESILRLSSLLRLGACRISGDVIEIRGQQFQYVTACTFVDVALACIPLIWNIKASLARNVGRVGVAFLALFLLNVIRLEITVLLYYQRIPWTVADNFVAGCSYFLVWLVIWHTRSWA